MKTPYGKPSVMFNTCKINPIACSVGSICSNGYCEEGSSKAEPCPDGRKAPNGAY